MQGDNPVGKARIVFAHRSCGFQPIIEITYDKPLYPGFMCRGFVDRHGRAFGTLALAQKYARRYAHHRKDVVTIVTDIVEDWKKRERPRKPPRIRIP